MNETCPDNVNYKGQSAYDVADLLKQYFRDLPEPIFTSKLTDTFLQIYQCKAWGVPGDSALLLGRARVEVHQGEDRALTAGAALSCAKGAAAAGGAGCHHPDAG